MQAPRLVRRAPGRVGLAAAGVAALVGAFGTGLLAGPASAAPAVPLAAAAQHVPATGPGTPTLAAGGRLAAGTSLASSVGQFRLAMQGDGNLVLYAGSVPLWSTHTQAPGGTALMQPNGKLVLRTKAGLPYWTSSQTPTSAAALTMQTDGNVVLSSATGAVVWSTRTGQRFPATWRGGCDSGANPGSHQLSAAAQLWGVVACGGGSDRLVRFYPGAWGEYEWQCVELSMRFLWLTYGVTPYGANGKDVVANYKPAYGGGLVAVANGSGSAPTTGDVLSWGATKTDAYGHTAVVLAAAVDTTGTGTVTVMEENASATGLRVLPVVGWTVGTNITGWLHKPSNTPVLTAPPATPPTTPPATSPGPTPPPANAPAVRR